MTEQELRHHPFAPKFAPRNPFERPYRFGSTRGGSSAEAEGVNYASSLGKICESVALQTLTNPPEISPSDKDTLLEGFQTVTSFLRRRFTSIKIKDGETTLSHASLVPHYLDAIQDTEVRASLATLAGAMKDIFPETDFSNELLNHIDSFDSPRDSILISPRVRYLIDTILTTSRLVIDKENLQQLFLGKLIPDVSLGYKMAGGQAVQFDGLFFPKTLTIPNFTNSIDKENFLFSLGKEPPKRYQVTVPLILDGCVPLEVKTVYRARSVAARPPISRVPGFSFEEFLNRLGRCCAEARLAVAPRAVVFLYLGGVQPNAVYYKKLDSHLYHFWAEDLSRYFLYELPEVRFKPENIEDQVGSLLDFTTMMADKLEKEEAKAAKLKVIVPGVPAKIQRLAGFAKVVPGSKSPITTPSPEALEHKRLKHHHPQDKQENLIDLANLKPGKKIPLYDSDTTSQTPRRPDSRPLEPPGK